MPVAACPECHGDVQVDGALALGQRVNCAACGAVLEIVNLRPLELDWAFEEPLPKSDAVEESVA